MDPTTILFAPPNEPLTLQQLSKERGVSPVTCWRWSLHGIGGVRLPTVKVGNKRLTTRSIFVEWCRTLTAIANGEAMPVTNSDMQYRSMMDRAEREADQLLGLRLPPRE